MNLYTGLGLQLPEPDMFRNAIVGMKYFLIGINLYWFRSVLWKTLEKWGGVLFIGFISMAILLKFFSPLNYYGVAEYSLISAYLVLSFFLGKYRFRAISWFAKLTLGIYLIHQPIVANMLNKLVRFLPLFNPWGIQIIYFIAVVAVSCIILITIRRYKILRLVMFGEGY